MSKGTEGEKKTGFAHGNSCLWNSVQWNHLVYIFPLDTALDLNEYRLFLSTETRVCETLFSGTT